MILKLSSRIICLLSIPTCTGFHPCVTSVVSKPTFHPNNPSIAPGSTLLSSRTSIKDTFSNKANSSSRNPKKKKQVRSWQRSISTITGRWREQYEALKVFAEQNGHCRVPYNYPANPSLGRWVMRQRRLYRRMHEREVEEEGQSNGGDRHRTIPVKVRSSSVLTDERREALEKIGFSFKIARRSSWNTRFDELCVYRAIHGNCLVPLHSKEPGLGSWVRSQRNQYRNLLNGKPSKCSLTPERISALQAIGFVWDTQRNDLWKERFDELRDFKAVYGHCHVPINYHENRQLGAWVANQRISYKNYMAGIIGGSAHYDDGIDEDDGEMTKRGGVGMTQERIAALDSIGFVWDQSTYNWYTMYERLKMYIKDRKPLQGDGTVIKDSIDSSKLFYIPPEDVENRDLRMWISLQRREHKIYLDNKNMADNNPSSLTTRKPCTMTARRKRALDAIGFAWQARAPKDNNETVGPSVDDWAKLFEQMREKGIRKNAELTLVNVQDQVDVNKQWSEYDLLELWNMENEE